MPCVVLTSDLEPRIECEDPSVLVVRGTKKLLDRVGGVTAVEGDASTTALGDWYATALFWKPQVALLVNETTLLPVAMPLAPAATVVERFPQELANLLRALGVTRRFIDPELVEMREPRLAKTASRSVLGVMNEFVRMAGYSRKDEPDIGFVELRCGWPRSRAGPSTRVM